MGEARVLAPSVWTKPRCPNVPRVNFWGKSKYECIISLAPRGVDLLSRPSVLGYLHRNRLYLTF